VCVRVLVSECIEGGKAVGCVECGCASASAHVCIVASVCIDCRIVDLATCRLCMTVCSRGFSLLATQK